MPYLMMRPGSSAYRRKREHTTNTTPQDPRPSAPDEAPDSSMGSLGDVYAYLIDDVFGALLGVVWGYCLPVVADDSQYAWIQALLHDVVGSTILCIVSYYMVHRFGRELDSVVAQEVVAPPSTPPHSTRKGRKARGDKPGADTSLSPTKGPPSRGGEGVSGIESPAMSSPVSPLTSVRSPRTGRARFASAMHFEVHVMVVSGLSLALSSLHATFAEELWESLSFYITSGESVGGACVLNHKTAQVLSALVLCLCVCAVFTWLCVVATHRSETAISRSWAAVWDLLATSFSYAIGWTFFTALTLSMGCLPGNFEYYVITQLTRAVPLSLFSLAVYFKLLPWLHLHTPFPRTELFIDILKDVVYTLLTLAWLNVYYEPITYFYSSTTAAVALYSIALGLTLVGGYVLRLPLLDLPPPSHPDRPLVCWVELWENLLEWMTMFAWWYPMDTSYAAMYDTSGWLDRAEHTVGSALFSVLAALFVTALVAAMVASLALLDPKLDRLDGLPEWATDLLTHRSPGRVGEETALLPKAAQTDDEGGGRP